MKLNEILDNLIASMLVIACLASMMLGTFVIEDFDRLENENALEAFITLNSTTAFNLEFRQPSGLARTHAR